MTTRPARRTAADRVFADRSTGTSDGFAAPGDEATVVNVSGHPGSQPVPRDHASMLQHVAPRPGRRRQITVNAQSSERLDAYTAQALAHAAHRADQEHFARQKDTSPEACLAHLLGRDASDGDRGIS